MTELARKGRRIRVIVADDHPIIRKMVRSVLQEQPHIEVCAEADNGAQALEQAKKIKPDVTILNIAMPVLNGFDAAREIKRQLPEVAIVILSTHADQQFVKEAKKIGIGVYVSKSKVGDALVKAVEAAANGKDFVLLE